MNTYVQLGCVAFDHIENPAELAILESISGEEEEGQFVYIVDGDESLTRSTSLHPLYGERFTAEEVSDMIAEDCRSGEYRASRVVVDPEIDGISDYLEEAGYERRKAFDSARLLYVAP